jgi:hypothetical protein
MKFYFTMRPLQFSKFAHKSLGSPISPPLFFLSQAPLPGGFSPASFPLRGMDLSLVVAELGRQRVGALERVAPRERARERRRRERVDGAGAGHAGGMGAARPCVRGTWRWPAPSLRGGRGLRARAARAALEQAPRRRASGRVGGTARLG